MSTAADVDCAIIGAGVVGLAIAKALAEAGREVVILEAADAVGTGISSRNSEVIHAGIYYPFDSLMRRFCVEGRERLYAYCGERGIAHRRCGKLIVATSDEEQGKLAGIAARARENGVSDITMLSKSEALGIEAELDCHGALLSPSTGIIDSHALMLAMQGDAEAHGAVIAFNTPVMTADVTGDNIKLETGGAEPAALSCRILVNAAGLEAPGLALRFSGFPERHVPQSYLAKGSYFSLAGKSPFSRLIYPVPVPGGLGTHLTLDLNGNARFGPDVEWIGRIDYAVDPRKAVEFAQAIRRYWPGVSAEALVPAYSGIRPKIVPQGAPAQDFLIQDEMVHRIPGLINLFGIESPGLTASLAIASHVAKVALTRSTSALA
jgi:L-2-hydroxyglutarate oxidase LhgO